jgi:hypothetical protein
MKLPLQPRGRATGKLLALLCTFAALCGGAVFLANRSSAAENTGTVRQPLVAGTVTSEAKQEEYGLLTLTAGTGGCSASLLRNDWAISAAHCVELKDSKNAPLPDKARPGQNRLKSLDSITVDAAWGGGQTKNAVRVETFRPYDVALIQLDSPLNVGGKTSGYSRIVFQDGQFPYFGHPVGVPIMVFGRGIFQFASGSGDSAMASQADDQFRVGYFKTTRQNDDGTLYWYPSEGGKMVAGGDSGGPSFAWVSNGWVLVGVHALTKAEYIEGKPKTGWDWVKATPEAADAPLAPVWPQIQKIMGPAPPAEPDPTGRNEAVFETTVPFGSVKPDFFHILYRVEPDGSLTWHRHIMTTTRPAAARGDGPATAWTPGLGNATRQGAAIDKSAQPDGAKPRTLGKRKLPAAKTRLWHVWEPARTLNNRRRPMNWQNFKAVLPAGKSGIYALSHDGVLQWYRHDGAYDGGNNWTGPVEVGTGWNIFDQVVAGGDGVLYGILPDGTLRWYRHTAYTSPTGDADEWAAPKDVAKGWNHRHVFSGGEGVLYYVNEAGDLMWTKHKTYLDALAKPAGSSAIGAHRSWEAPRTVGTDWGRFSKIFSAGEGDIYAIEPNGDLFWYKHDGWRDGTPAWRGGERIASGWGDCLFAFGLIDGAESVSVSVIR